MMRSNIFALLISVFVCAQAYGAPEERNSVRHSSQNVCINAASIGNDKLIESFRENNDPLKRAFLDMRRTREAYVPTTCSPANQAKELSTIEKISDAVLTFFNDENENGNHDRTATSIVPITDNEKDLIELSKIQPRAKAPVISRECVEASMKRAPGNTGYTCDYPTQKEAKRGYNPKTQSVSKAYGVAGGATLQCVNNEMVDYAQFAINKVIDCLSPAVPIDSRVIFQKLNNETGFNPSIANLNSGMGAGQITSPAAQEITTEAGKGRYLLENIMKSNNKSCEPFKQIAKKDLKSYPRINANNFCSYASMGDGFARNLLYSVSYYVTMRDQYLIPALQDRAIKLANNEELVSKLTAISYGREGLQHAKWLIQRFRVNDRTNIKTLIQLIQKNSAYLAEIDDKMKEMLCLQKGLAGADCKAMKPTPEELRGDTCVSTK